MTDSRLDSLRSWLKGLEPSWQLDLPTLAPASADASFRRYFRIASKNPDFPSLIVMDAPPQHEPLDAFIEVDLLLENAGLNVPKILEKNVAEGFLLLNDLGTKTYLGELNSDSADYLYRDATHALVQMQLASKPDVLPNYDEALLKRELDLFPEWYLGKHLHIELSKLQNLQIRQAFELIIQNNLAQAKVYVHRDYHSRNLMMTEKNNPGVIDFQDAVYGPITYDASSLWRDAYISWPEERVIDWVIKFWEEGRQVGLPMPNDFGQFYRDFEWMGLQRHLKILGIFARLFHRDGKDGYLKDIPLVLEYAIATANRYIELKPLARILESTRTTQDEESLIMNKPNLIPCFLLAAGRGERMRPLTDELPKPLLTIKNKSLLAWHVEALSSAGIQDVVINHAWLGKKIEDALGNGSQFGLNITYSPETSALETAGGIRKALPLLNPSDYFLVINGDVFSPNLPIQQLLDRACDLRSMPRKPLAHILMVPNPVQHPEGDFYIKDSQVSNEPMDGAEKLTFSGIGLYHRDLFKDLELDVPTQLAPILREAMSKNRVSGEKYTGPWHDVGTPQRLQELNAANE